MSAHGIVTSCYNDPIDTQPDSNLSPQRLPAAAHISTRPWLVRLLPLILFALLTIIAARPLLAHLDTAIVGTDQDIYINPWADMWTQIALQDSRRSLWFTDYLFHPHGAHLHYHSFSHLTSAVSLTLRPLFGALPAYNLTILLHITLAALSMFHLARYLTGSAQAALLAGIVFAFNSHNLWQTAHPVLVSIWPLPWSALFLLQALERRDPRRALIAASFVLLAALCSTLMLILTALWLAFILLLALLTGRLRPGRLQRPALPTLLLFAVAAILLAAIPLLPLLGELLLHGNTSFVVEPGPVLPTDALAPLRPYWLGLLPRSLHFGLAPLALLIFALLHWRAAWPWFLFLLVVFLFAIGPHPTAAGAPLPITLPWSEFVRPLLRHTHRLNVLLSAALAVLVAFGYHALATRLLPKRYSLWPLALLLAALTYAELMIPPFPYTTPRVSPFYTDYLQSIPDDVALAILPTGRQQDKLYMYYQTLHGHPITGGVISRPREDVFRFIRSNPILRAGAINWEPAPLPTDATAALAHLARNGVGFLVLDKRLFQRHNLDLPVWRAAIPFAPAYEDDLLVAFPTTPD